MDLYCEKIEKTEGKHPTQKPIVLLERIIKASTKEGATILDPFLGGGTTSVAAMLSVGTQLVLSKIKNFVSYLKKEYSGHKKRQKNKVSNYILISCT